MNQFEVGVGGRVKMAGGSVDMYYQAAEPLLTHGSDGALEAHSNFMELRDNPPPELSAAYFPSVGPELKQRLRGAGLYRYLRMDQGPGGNFTAFTVDGSGEQQTYDLSEPIPHFPQRFCPIYFEQVSRCSNRLVLYNEGNMCRFQASVK